VASSSTTSTRWVAVTVTSLSRQGRSVDARAHPVSGP